MLIYTLNTFSIFITAKRLMSMYAWLFHQIRHEPFRLVGPRDYPNGFALSRTVDSEDFEYFRDARRGVHRQRPASSREERSFVAGRDPRTRLSWVQRRDRKPRRLLQLLAEDKNWPTRPIEIGFGGVFMLGRFSFSHRVSPQHLLGNYRRCTYHSAIERADTCHYWRARSRSCGELRNT